MNEYASHSYLLLNQFVEPLEERGDILVLAIEEGEDDMANAAIEDEVLHVCSCSND